MSTFHGPNKFSFLAIDSVDLAVAALADAVEDFVLVAELLVAEGDEGDLAETDAFVVLFFLRLDWGCLLSLSCSAVPRWLRLGLGVSFLELMLSLSRRVCSFICAICPLYFEGIASSIWI